VACSLAAATLEAGSITSISGNPVIAAPQLALTYLLVPGLLVAAMFGSLSAAAVVNGLFYMGLVKLIYWIATRSKRRAAKARG
jgi:hypothetical protein